MISAQARLPGAASLAAGNPPRGTRDESRALMSDDVLSLIPTDPRWQPAREAGEQTAAIASGLASREESDLDVETDVTWHENVTVVDCGQNLERIACGRCHAEIGTSWWGDLLDERSETGFDDLVVRLPCCGAEQSLNDLDYGWPCGFAKFEIAIWNPGLDWFTSEELTLLAETLGHPVRQIRAHI
jgi:hypothetical protein